MDDLRESTDVESPAEGGRRRRRRGGRGRGRAERAGRGERSGRGDDAGDPSRPPSPALARGDGREAAETPQIRSSSDRQRERTGGRAAAGGRRAEAAATSGGSVRWIAGAVLPVLAVGALLAFLVLRGVGLDDRALPPLEELSVTRIELPAAGQMRVHVVNSGPQPSTISQVMVDEAFWSFRIQPGNLLDRLDRATIDIPYPWVRGEPHEVKLLTSTGLTFAREVAVAVETPQLSWDSLARFGLLGIYVGVLPIVLGLLLYPALRRVGNRGIDFLLALTIGLLVFLAVDTILEALEIARETPGIYQTEPLVFLAALVTVLALTTLGRTRRGREGFTPLGVAYLIALGIGLHNLGEGLAIGAAFTLGELALGSFLVVGFTLHNITEGIGIAAPLLRDRPPLRSFALLALLAGFPAAIGTWIGAFSYSPTAAAVFLGIGVGAILQVVYEVARLFGRRDAGEDAPLFSGLNLAGLLVGIAIMYATALLVAV
ncbi:MAG: ZIP family metal transporter [Gemmatimonadetes bacterium]|nr:ZIP family metal transporter [Gemmatimonadota bacterium]